MLARSIVLGWFCWLSTTAPAEEIPKPVAARVDQLIAAQAGHPVAPPVDDAGFCRRVMLDLAGRIPTTAELQSFVADGSANKRQRLVDQLLAGPEYPRRMRELFHVVLMERLGDHEEWSKYLESSFAANVPWDQFVARILSPNPEDETQRGAAFYLTKRLENYGQQPVDLPGLTRDVGRMFLGVDLQCAQCHDHLFVDDYKQVDFQGLHTFLSHTFIRQDVKFPAVGEKILDKKTDFMSVFIKEPKQTGPRLPFGNEVEVAVFANGEEFAVPPDKATKFPGQPKFSPLKILSEQLPTAANERFVRNGVNRCWWMMFGRGLVHPVDLTHAGNPPSHPEVLDLLAEEFVAHRFDIKWLLRELALTEAYQRSSELPADGPEPAADRYVVALEKPLSPEQLAASAWTATGHAEPLADDVRKKFIAAYANPPREPEGDFAPSVKAALFLSHDATVLSWLQPGSGNLAERLTQNADTSALIRDLYHTVLSRAPLPEESAMLTQFVTQSTDRPKAIGHAIWALLTSTEFCVNH